LSHSRTLLEYGGKIDVKIYFTNQLSFSYAGWPKVRSFSMTTCSFLVHTNAFVHKNLYCSKYFKNSSLSQYFHVFTVNYKQKVLSAHQDGECLVYKLFKNCNTFIKCCPFQSISFFFDSANSNYLSTAWFSLCSMKLSHSSLSSGFLGPHKAVGIREALIFWNWDI